MSEGKRPIWGKGWFWIAVIVFVVSVSYIVRLSPSSGDERYAHTVPAITPAPTIQPAFNVPRLVGLNMKGIEKVMGTAKGDNPTALQLKMGIDEWQKTYESQGHELLITYTYKTGKVLDFFMGTDDPRGYTSDRARLLDLTNTTTSSGSYTVEFVSSYKNPDAYTGIKIIPKN